MTLYLGENLISGVATPVEGARNIGQIVQSTLPLNDAGLHLIDGALIDGNGIYAEFVDYIAALDQSAQWFTDEASWQQSVLDNGVCGKFVYDSVNNTVRLPKITGFIEGTTDLNALSELIEAGLPNIYWDNGANFIRSTSGTSDTTNCPFILANNSVVASYTSGNTNRDIRGFDASQSNSIYGNSTTVQPQAINVLYYIVIATSTKTNVEVNIDNIATDLNGKADVDLSNCTKPYITESYVNGTSGYNKYSNGYYEEWGIITGVGSANGVTVTFLNPFKDTNYNVIAMVRDGSTAYSTETVRENFAKKTVSSTNFITTYVAEGGTRGYAGYPFNWRVRGYIA